MSMKKRPVPLNLVPTVSRSSFSLTESGTFTECGLRIGKMGMVISQEESLESFPSRPCSASTLSSIDRLSNSRVGTAGTDGLNPSMNGGSNTNSTPGTAVALGGGQGTGSDFPFRISLDDFEEGGYLGSGSSGVVKLVRHKGTGDMLVMKVIPFDVNDEKVRKQVIMELRTMHAIVHSGVLRSFESFLDNGAIVIMMEYMDGGSLADIVAAHPGGLPEAFLAELARQTLTALNYLHTELRIVHRDIKLSNLLLNRRGDAKIADFGVSGHLASNASKCMSWVGTATYMSPERIRGESYSFDSDVWSLGLALLEAALGKFPYGAGAGAAPAQAALGTFWDLLDIIVENPPPLPQAGRFSPEFCDFIGRCLQKEPALRPTAAALLQHPFILKHAAGPRINMAAFVPEHVARRGLGGGGTRRTVGGGPSPKGVKGLGLGHVEEEMS